MTGFVVVRYIFTSINVNTCTCVYQVTQTHSQYIPIYATVCLNRVNKPPFAFYKPCKVIGMSKLEKLAYLSHCDKFKCITCAWSYRSTVIRQYNLRGKRLKRHFVKRLEGELNPLWYDCLIFHPFVFYIAFHSLYVYL